MEHYRRIRNESYTMGTLYWQLVRVCYSYAFVCTINCVQTLHKCVSTIHLPICQHPFSFLPIVPSQNDIWQAQSWASIEYDGTWKLLHYRTMHSYAKILISPYDLDGNISAYAVSDDHLNDHICDLIIEVTAWKDVLLTMSDYILLLLLRSMYFLVLG